MKYAYVVSMTPYTAKSGSSQGKTILGIHATKASAIEHYNGCVEYRKKLQAFDKIVWAYGERPLAYPDWCSRSLYATYIGYKPMPVNRDPAYYTVSEIIDVDQWKVSRPKKGKKCSK